MKANSNFPSAGKTLGTSFGGKGRDQDSPEIGLKWSYESVRKFDCAAGWRNFGTVGSFTPLRLQVLRVKSRT